jgi:hypothetical protein
MNLVGVFLAPESLEQASGTAEVAHTPLATNPNTTPRLRTHDLDKAMITPEYPAVTRESMLRLLGNSYAREREPRQPALVGGEAFLMKRLGNLRSVRSRRCHWKARALASKGLNSMP